MSNRPEILAWLDDACPGWLRLEWGAAAVIYRVFSRDGTLLYIGMTMDLVTRFLRHSMLSRPASHRTIEWARRETDGCEPTSRLHGGTVGKRGHPEQSRAGR